MNEIYDMIYNNVFSKINKSNIDVFLCGGESKRNYISYRDQLRSKLNLIKPINILYPEDLFMELLNRKKYNLLELEQFLAINCDYIIIVCESPGSQTELGAFVNNEYTLKKVIVLLKTKYKNSKSFITQGPVQHVKNNNNKRVIYYNDNNLDDVIEKLKAQICVKTLKNGFIVNKKIFKDLDIITGQYNFIVLILYFFSKMNVKELDNQIKRICNEKNLNINSLDVIFFAAVRRLFKDGLIRKTGNKGNFKYELTQKGYKYTLNLLYLVEIKKKFKLFDKIRLKILNA